MSGFKSCLFQLALATALVGATASSAIAQQGKFTLPFEARWGGQTLEPGDYTLQVPTWMSWPKVISLTNAGKTIYVLASTQHATQSKAGESYLRIDQIGKLNVVRELKLGASGSSFLFPAPKVAHEQAAARGAEKQTQIAVMVRK